MIVKILAACAVLALSGCATIEKLVTSPAAPVTFVVASDAAVGVAVGKGVPAQLIANIASELEAFDTGASVTIPALTGELSALEAKANLNVAEQAAVSELTLAFSAIIQAQTTNGTIDATTQATIQTVLKDVISAAELFGATAPVATVVPTTQTDEQTTPGIAPAPVGKSALMSTIESPAAVGAAAAAVLVGSLQAFSHISLDGRTSAGVAVLFTVAAAYLSL